jgi:hypothetical protein
MFAVTQSFVYITFITFYPFWIFVLLGTWYGTEEDSFTFEVGLSGAGDMQ